MKNAYTTQDAQAHDSLLAHDRGHSAHFRMTGVSFALVQAALLLAFTGQASAQAEDEQPKQDAPSEKKEAETSPEKNQPRAVKPTPEVERREAEPAEGQPAQGAEEAAESKRAPAAQVPPADPNRVEVEEGEEEAGADTAESEAAAPEAGTLATPEEPAESTVAAPEETESEELEVGSSAKVEPRINPDAIPEIRGREKPSQRGTIGLEPGAPQAAAMAGGVTPSFGRPSANDSDWVFDIHGYLQLPLRVGLNEREDAGEGQKVTVLHTPPEIPGTYGTFEYTSLVPDPWAQLNFSYGNRDVTATVIIAARTVSNANGYYNPADQLGINDAFVTFHPHSQKKNRFHVHVGAFANRYGIMGEYDMGRYGTPLIGRVSGMGATATGQFDLGSMKLSTEAGVMGPLNKAPVGVEPAGWNGYTDPNAGTTFAGHAHAALGLTDEITIGVHGIRAFAQDDRATTTTQKDGAISVFGADGRFSLQRFGHLYVGYALTDADTARSVSGVIRVLNAPGGLGLMEEYFGLQSEGTGQLNTFGAQYDLSLGNLLRYPNEFEGNAPDLVLSGFTLGTIVDSPVPEFDGVFKLKYGGEATYAFLKWMGAGVRYDRVMPDTDDSTQTHAALSPRLFFKSDWGSRDQVVLQYSRYFYGSNTAVVAGVPPRKDPTVVPDEDVFSLTAQIWW